MLRLLNKILFAFHKINAIAIAVAFVL
jgi:hypothetical protein